MKIPGSMFEPAIKWASEMQAEFCVTFDALDIVRFAPVEVLSEVKLTTQRPHAVAFPNRFAKVGLGGGSRGPTSSPVPAPMIRSGTRRR
ncbi:hypothetical protein ACVJBD_001025 [Rhizobium mongolense]